MIPGFKTPLSKRGGLAFAHDVAMACLAFALALALRLGETAPQRLLNADLWVALGIFAGVAAVVFLATNLYRGIWRYASLNDLVTLNRAWKGTDQAFSLEPVGLRKMVRDLERARISLGDGRKHRYPSEEKPLFKMAKKLVAARDLPAGHKVTAEDIAIKVPNDGLPPYEIDKVIGRELKHAMTEDQDFKLEDLA